MMAKPDENDIVQGPIFVEIEGLGGLGSLFVGQSLLNSVIAVEGILSERSIVQPVGRGRYEIISYKPGIVRVRLLSSNQCGQSWREPTLEESVELIRKKKQAFYIEGEVNAKRYVTALRKVLGADGWACESYDDGRAFWPLSSDRPGITL